MINFRNWYKQEAKLKEDEEAEMAGWTTTGELSTNTASGETVSSDPTAQQSQSSAHTQGQVMLLNFYC